MHGSISRYFVDPRNDSLARGEGLRIVQIVLRKFTCAALRLAVRIPTKPVAPISEYYMWNAFYTTAKTVFSERGMHQTGEVPRVTVASAEVTELARLRIGRSLPKIRCLGIGKGRRLGWNDRNFSPERQRDFTRAASLSSHPIPSPRKIGLSGDR